MSHHHHRKQRRSRSRSPIQRREFEHNPNKDRSKDYERRHLSTPSSRQYDIHPQTAIKDILDRPGDYPPIMQSLVHEFIVEQNKRQLFEERLNVCQHDYALLRAQYEQARNNFALLRRDYDQSQLELNELRLLNTQYRLRIDHLSSNDRKQIHRHDDNSNAKRSHRH